MGLDTTITLSLRNKKTEEEVASVEVAYWRKYWGLTLTLLHIAREEPNWWNERKDRESEDDFLTTCNPCVLTDWIEKITELLKNPEANEWSDSLWGSVCARGYTARQLEDILIAESIINSMNAYSLELCSDLFEKSTDAYFKRINPFKDEKLINEVENNPRDFEWLVELENSY